MAIDNPLEPSGFTGFGCGHYTPCGAWPEDTIPLVEDDYDPRKNATLALNRLNQFGPGAWADAEGGLITCGLLDAPL